MIGKKIQKILIKARLANLADVQYSVLSTLPAATHENLAPKCHIFIYMYVYIYIYIYIYYMYVYKERERVIEKY